MSVSQGSIRSKLAAALMLTALLAVILVAAVGVRLIRQAADQASLAELRRQADAISAETTFVRRDPNQTVRFLRNALSLSQAALYQLSDGTLSLVGGEPDVPLTPEDVAVLNSGSRIEGKRSTRAGGFVFVAQPIGGSGLVLVIGRESGGFSGVPVGRRLLLAAAIAVGVAAMVAFYLSRRIADPLRELASAASDIAAGGFERRVPVTSDDEIGVVAESFNQMAQDLGDADRRQREFFLSVSHELRTPLTAIQGYAEALEDGTAEGEKAREAAGVIAGESRRLNRLVSDVLDLARIDARRFQTEVEDVDLGLTFLSVKNAFLNKAADASVEIVVADTDLKVRADPDRLTQVLSNLVENALRYSPVRSTIAIDADASNTNGMCRIEVSDRGIGLQPEDLSRAFERQYLWSKYRGLRDVGTGLGLAITKELVEGMGGNVEASNRPEGGATFAVMLPVV